VRIDRVFPQKLPGFLAEAIEWADVDASAFGKSHPAPIAIDVEVCDSRSIPSADLSRLGAIEVPRAQHRPLGIPGRRRHIRGEEEDISPHQGPGRTFHP
jgi:hypothetical protein